MKLVSRYPGVVLVALGLSSSNFPLTAFAGHPFVEGVFSLPRRFRTALAVLLVATMAMLICAPQAHANLAARRFFTPGTGAGVLSAPSTGKIRVVEVSLLLDFRPDGRGGSTAEYLLANLDQTESWQDDLVFVSTASSVLVTIDGVPAEVKHQGRRYSQRPEIVKALGEDIKGNSFPIRLAPRQQRRIEIRFTCEPAKTTVYQPDERRRDGLFRHAVFSDPLPSINSHHFTYPLWPAYGFEGGVGEMAVSVLTSLGAAPPDGNARAVWSMQELADGQARWTVRLAEARSIDQAPLREVTVRYPPPSRWSLGASAFAGVRFPSQNEYLPSAHLALSADLIVAGLGAVSIGGETAFTHSASVSLGFLHGEASSWVSWYLGGAALATFRPAPTPGFELRAGIRLIWLPLDLAFQVHPWVAPGEGHVARYRLIAGLRVGVW